jgi:prepilin-type N-terminal cleavage/methylation domain-containing protein
VSHEREEGFTLIELAVALGVFAIVMVSLTLLFDQSLTAANRSRFDELGKTLAQRKLEEVRSLPFFISQKEEAGDVDILDFYFPGTTNGVTPTGAAGTYNGTANVWTYTSTESNVTGQTPAFTRAVSVQFVSPQDTGALTVLAPLAGYTSNTADLDQPSTDAVRVTVTVSRTFDGQPRSVTLDTVVAQSEQEFPSVDASGSVLGAQVSGVSFRDGDVGGVSAEILAEAGKIQTQFREITESSSQVTVDPAQVVERDPVTGTQLQADGPTTGQASASVPNSTTGTTQSTSASLASGSVGSVNGTGAIAAWDSTSPSASAEARVSLLHSLNPEGRGTVATRDFRLNARDQGEGVPLQMVALGQVTGSVDQRSTTAQASVESIVDIGANGSQPGVTVWASRQFGSNNKFKGVVTIGSVHVDAKATAGETLATTVVNWTVENLRVWDPLKPNGGGPLGDYGPSYTFGFRSDCGGWVADPALCGPLRTDGKLPFANPNPVVIPASYVGLDAQGNPDTSLSVVAGVTVQDSTLDVVAGTSSASVAQKNILNITTRGDLAGAVPLEDMLLGVGDANVSVSYIKHAH